MSEIEIEIGQYRVKTTNSYGPRIVGTRREGSPEMLAQLPDDVAIDLDEGGAFLFRGGHRLWAAPEVPAITYAPDDHQCEVTESSEGLTIKAPPDRAGLVKELRVTADEDALVIDHTITNAGSVDITIAPWGITQFRLGGTALLPLAAPGPATGLQADRNMVLWPYTDLSDDRLTWTETAVLVEASPGEKLKIGSGPTPGHLGYFYDGHLFTKTISPARDTDYPDLGAVGQVFVNEDFCELESVGPTEPLSPGSSASLQETWMISECPDIETAGQLVLNQGPS